jgi:protocatechuate 3,4-dioxygenase beta subunit
MSCNSISGFVYHDADNNGLLEPGETPITNSVLELHDASGHLVATTTTDANGFYNFSTDPRIDTTPGTRRYDISFPDRPTEWTDTRSLPQFNPLLGTLTSVEIQPNDPLTSTIRIENLDSAPATIHTTSNGNATLSGPSLPGLVTTFAVDHTFNAAAFDGIIDFSGPSGHTYGPEITPGNNSVTLTSSSALAPYIGTGQVAFTVSTHSSSTATGSANLVLQVNTSVSAQVHVIYHYIPNNCLVPGDYTIVQPVLPPGYLNGLKTSGNITPIAGSNLVNYIHVSLGPTSSLTSNNFGEVRPASLGGYVYYDLNDNGIKDPGEPGLGGIGVTLSGVNDLGQAVNLAVLTAADGSYNFTNLRPGIYTLGERGPDGYIDGKDTIGTPGGTTALDQFVNIHLTSGYAGVNNNFGELKPGSLSGFVYLDNDNNGIKEPDEPGIGNVLVTLAGTDDQGHPVFFQQRTAADGAYHFTGLRPGTYAITRTHPDGYVDGLDTIGTPGGTTSPGQFSHINLVPGFDGVDNDFAELLPPAHAGPLPPPSQPPPTQIVGKQFFLASRAFHG